MELFAIFCCKELIWIYFYLHFDILSGQYYLQRTALFYFNIHVEIKLQQADKIYAEIFMNFINFNEINTLCAR